jgi:AbrB family looped-hinge helix DNA binding protein
MSIDEVYMSTVMVSPKFQVVIPKEVRASMGLKAGELLQVIQYGHRIELIPVKAMRSMKGFLKGMDTDFTREDDRQ